MTQAVKECYLTQVDQFAEENPETTYEDLLAAFGPAEDFAAEMLAAVPRDQVEEAKSRQSKDRRLVRTVLAVVLAAVALGAAIRMYHLEQVVSGEFYVVYDPAKEISDEEFWAQYHDTPLVARSETEEGQVGTGG